MIFNLNTVYSHSMPISEIKPDKKEILRYMGQKGEATPEIMQLVDSNLKNTLFKASPKGAFVIREISVMDQKIKIGDASFHSKNLSENLSGCNHVIIFVLTLGTEADRAIESKKSLSPLEALAISALYTDALEKYADSFTNEIAIRLRETRKFLKPRYSPGYGDFSIENQPYFINETDAYRRCGVSVTDSLILTPSKSITGVMGISDDTQKCNEISCERCGKTDCEFRKIKN